MAFWCLERDGRAHRQLPTGYSPCGLYMRPKLHGWSGDEDDPCHTLCWLCQWWEPTAKDDGRTAPLNVSKKTLRRRKQQQARWQAPGSHTLAQVKLLHELVGKKCWGCLRYCPERYDPTRGVTWGWTEDHIVPLRHGGSNDIDNIQILCSSCNAIKGRYQDWNFRDAYKEFAYEAARALGEARG